jgi:hypothetical protein
VTLIYWTKINARKEAKALLGISKDDDLELKTWKLVIS